MKTPTYTHLLLFALFSSVACIPTVSAQLTYDYTTNPGWSAANAWTNTVPAATDWIPGSNAVINATSNKNINFTTSTTIGNLTVTGTTSSTANITNTVATSLTFSGGEISVSAVFATLGSVSLQGNYTKTGGGFLRLFAPDSPAAYVGTATVSGGRLEVAGVANLGSSSNFTINSGAAFQIRNSGTYNLGAVVVNGGTFELSRNNSNQTITSNVTSLSGSGGLITTVVRTSASPVTPGTTNTTLNVNQNSATNTSFSGTIEGYNVANAGANEAFLTLNKLGDGSLTLSGNINLRRQTTVSAGTLLINSSNATFTNNLDTTAISVNGALGGTGTLEITGGDNVVVGATGSLIAGLAGSAGQTTFELSGGSLNLSAASDGPATGWLNFDLGADTTPGLTYDQILLTGSGSLNIGTALDFSAFTFNTLAGFGPGNYTLFATPSTITGNLGTATGTVGGFDGTLFFSGNNLVLSVIPEPSIAAYFLSVAGFAFLRKRLKKRS